MNQSDRTLTYHLHAMKTLLDLVWAPKATKSLGGVGGTRQPEPTKDTLDVRLLCEPTANQIRAAFGLPKKPEEYDPNQQAERTELRCPVCGRRKCPLDVRRGM